MSGRENVGERGRGGIDLMKRPAWHPSSLLPRVTSDACKRTCMRIGIRHALAPWLVAGSVVGHELLCFYRRREPSQFCIRFDLMTLYANRLSSIIAINGPIAERKMLA